ncbi:hypothetical protein yc1106_08814 [Curvularia clavata]|uniref:Uncharacterized protein n=1 Tax=Curvularia clavata TaxID=95742 RepID=A0A9Q8ZG15_CURCL|nr:hypothetical protein yc1106_08814 [Curvularia clavata]
MFARLDSSYGFSYDPPLSPFLRSLGLGILCVLITRFSHRHSQGERKKPIRTVSLYLAIQRCAVHILPCAFSIFLITINILGYFIGFELAGEPGKTSQYTALLQIAAKIQELLIIASLTTIVVHKVRNDLIDGDGIPFGLVGVGALFTQLSFFWSTAFIGSVSNTRTVRRNAATLCLVILAGFIAVTAGPAVAVLLIPREQTWPAGGTKYWINGSSEDLWPSTVDIRHYMPDRGVGVFGPGCSSSDAYKNALCPAGGYEALASRYSSSDNPRPWSAPKDSRYTPAGLLIWSPEGQVPPYNLASAQRARVALESSATGVHGPTAWVAATINDEWQKAVDAIPVESNSRFSRYRYYNTMKSVIGTWIPAVRVVCSSLQAFNASQTSLAFPVVPEFGSAIRNNLVFDDQNPGEPLEMRMTELPGETLQKLRQMPYRSVVAVDLTNATWTTATLGLIVKGPTVENNQQSLSTCVIDARWAKGSVSVGLAQAVQPEIYSITNAPKSPFISATSYRAYDMFRINSEDRDSWRRIRITMDWFDAVNLKLGENIDAPSNVSKTDNRTLNNVSSAEGTTISSLVALATSDSFLVPTVEHTLASVFADAISRAGSWRVLNVSLPVQRKQFNPTSYHIRKPSYQSELLLDRQAYQNPSTMSTSPFTEFHVRQEITGYAFRVSATTDILALGVLFLHLTMALAHMLFSIIRRRSSSCWDSVPELISLAQQSSPSKVALENTTTGIERMSTFKKRARIRVSGSNSQHVELVFDEDHGGQDLLDRPSTNSVYG